jgi:hypothetical protein
LPGVNDDDILLWSDADDKWTISEYVPSTKFDTSPPANPKRGMLWQDTTNDEQALYCFDGTVWFEISGANGADGADGNIQDGASDGSQDGIIATWDSSYDQWRANTAVTVDANGNATFSGNLAYFNSVNDAAQVIVSSRNAGNEVISQTRYHALNSGGANVGGAIGHDGTSLCLSGVTSLTAGKHLTIDASGNATFGGDIKFRADNAIGLDILGAVDAVPSPQNHGYIATAGSGAGGANGDLLIAPRTSADTSIKFITGASPATRLTIDANGDATFSGKVMSTGGRFIGAGSGVAFSGDNMYPSNPDGTSSTGVMSIGTPAYKFKDAYFSGKVAAGVFYNSYAGSSGISFAAHGMDPADNTGAVVTGQKDIGSASSKWKDAHFSGSVNSTRMLADNLIQDGAPVVDSLQIIRAFMKLRDAVDDPDSTVEQLRDKLKVAVVDIIDQFQELVDSVEPEVSTMPAPEDS